MVRIFVTNDYRWLTPLCTFDKYNLVATPKIAQIIDKKDS